MRKRYLGAILVAVASLLGIVVSLKQMSVNEKQLRLANLSETVLASAGKGDTTWLILPREKKRVILLRADTSALKDFLTGEKYLDYRVIRTGGEWAYTLKGNWKNRLRYLLGDPMVLDTAAQWMGVRKKLGSFLDIDSEAAVGAANADTVLVKQFLAGITALAAVKRSTYVLDRSLYAERVRVMQADKLGDSLFIRDGSNRMLGWAGILGALFAGAAGVAGWLLKPSATTVSEAPAAQMRVAAVPVAEAESPSPPAETSNAGFERQVIEYEMVVRYARKFYGKYGHLFEDLQRRSGPVDEEFRKSILRQLAEMAVHAHTFSFYGVMDKYDRLNESPNARLLFEGKRPGELPPDQLKLFTFDAYKTDRKFRLLFEVLKGAHLNGLDALLEDQVYVPDELW
ncbi:hypothetical protein LZD49_09980 [Dyadobacter sp. CY261]|uniref:hypothetical protein n=1 Tax=Dyadobacter sp. CY261 TaxID=2907203 RepID=UPI001F24EA6D|nr:hypothetical protein [Dyadobacter sp. CY261]MCF0070800.1 hypothetical protein [Dyadobacter sp. CY261]